MEVKIPGSALGQTDGKTKNVAIIDVPGHYHFKDKINEALEDSKGIILVVDSKEKYCIVDQLTKCIGRSLAKPQKSYMKFLTI
jgi:translation elongation factor EF-4